MPDGIGLWNIMDYQHFFQVQYEMMIKKYYCKIWLVEIDLEYE